MSEILHQALERKTKQKLIPPRASRCKHASAAIMKHPIFLFGHEGEASILIRTETMGSVRNTPMYVIPPSHLTDYLTTSIRTTSYLTQITEQENFCK